jgi:hypothetical protein
MNRTSKRVAAIGMPLAVVAATGIAFAAWTSTGTGSGYAKATTASTLSTVDVSASAVAQLYPGGSGDLKVKFDNPNPYPVEITSISQNGAITSDKDANCTDAQGSTHPTGVSFATQSGPWDVPAHTTADGDGVLAVTLQGAVSMTNNSDDGCQGALFTVPVTFSGASNAS